jgi:hypothetical protein
MGEQFATSGCSYEHHVVLVKQSQGSACLRGPWRHPAGDPACSFWIALRFTVLGSDLKGLLREVVVLSSR